jgi:host factor-I protein
MTEFQTGLPSVRHIQGYIKAGEAVEIKLLTGDTLMGTIRWLDVNCLCLIATDERSLLVWLHAIAYMKPQEQE